MNKKTIFLLLFALVGAGAFLAYKFVNKATKDFNDKKPSAVFSMNDLIEKSNSDTAALSQLKEKLIAVNGMVKKISKESTAISIELGDTSTTSSIICQVDNRYLTDFNNLKENDPINLKGVLRGYTIDTDLGLGNTIELNYCTLNKE